MKKKVNIGIIGDYNPEYVSHPATIKALNEAAGNLSLEVNITWIPTPSLLTENGQKELRQFDGFWASSGSPYQSMEGAMKGIQAAREMGRPFIGTWGGFQHTLLEYAKNVARMPDAGHTEMDPDTPVPLLILASCPIDNPSNSRRLSGALKIKVNPDSLAYRIYQCRDIEETFNCNYELNPDYREKLESYGLKVSGVSENGGTRMIELPDHRFFLATGFIPQLNSSIQKPHPIMVKYLEAAAES